MNRNIFLKNGIPTLKVKEPRDLSEFLLIDVRRDDEFNAELGHIEGAKLVTLGPELEQLLDQTDKNTKILFICRSAARSGQATAYAKAQGFSEVYNMDGGMLEWNENNFPISRISE